ncbi:hypothetical protein BLA60_27850 [Actinophytocola xinjiangensis]|uniref:Uncharacterized protein n=1 Tax=Actinophytocola xinjiangensis TaxID=485602 RepID=A0A7Z0WIR1_9PSEU|nr:hypothetical protein [Actinophytocola xinjiangensis]OLF07381.1 hypothetical protein BLA60_27850 [Actinophytocola xinjiangensis]
MTAVRVPRRVAGIGAAFEKPVGDNESVATIASLTVGGLVVVLGVALMCRLDAARRILGGTGTLLTLHYVLALVIALLDDRTSEYAVMQIICLVSWPLATLLVLLPPAGRTMRGARRRQTTTTPHGITPPGHVRPW